MDGDGRLFETSSRERVAWWSFTKTLLAALSLRLCEDGVLDLDTPMADPRITVRRILQHRAGLPDYGPLQAYHRAVAAGEPPWSDAELFRRCPPDRLLFEPDTGWRYSNIGYLLLRRTIETATGADLGEVLRERILAPLGVPDARLATTCGDMATLALPPPHAYDPGWVFHGVVVGRVGDAALALNRLLSGHLLGQASLRTMLERRPIGGALPGRPWTSQGYGLGLMVGEMRSPGRLEPFHAVGHSAGGPGSAGAVYQIVSRDGAATAAVFTPGDSEAPAEFEALRIACGGG